MAGECVSNQSGLTEFDPLDNVDVLARCIFSEAENQSNTGKRGVYYVVVNRKAKNLSEFGGNTVKGVVLKPYQFDGMTLYKARCPNTSSVGWTNSLSIAQNGGTNPIGTCLWFNGNATYANNIEYQDGDEYYTGWGTPRKVVEKVIIEDHTFFRVEGY